jgi:hypothetical protein
MKKNNRYLNDYIRCKFIQSVNSQPEFYDNFSSASINNQMCSNNIIPLMYYHDYKLFKKQNKNTFQNNFLNVELTNNKIKLNDTYFVLPKHVLNNIKSNKISIRKVFILCLRYHVLGLYGSGLMISCHPLFYKNINKYFNCELFGSYFNHTYDNYCSLFPNLEKSLGSFFSFELESFSGYVCNPPFSEKYINATIHRILEFFKKKESLSVLLILPVWDFDGRTKLNLKIEFDDMPLYNVLRNKSKKYWLFNQNEFKYFHFFQNKSMYVCATYLFLLSNNPKYNNIIQCIDEAFIN